MLTNRGEKTNTVVGQEMAIHSEVLHAIGKNQWELSQLKTGTTAKLIKSTITMH